MKLEAGAVAIGVIAAGSGALSTFLQEQGIVVSPQLLVGLGVNFVLFVVFAVKLIADNRVMKSRLDDLVDWKKKQEEKEQEIARATTVRLEAELEAARRRDLQRRDQLE